MVAEAPTGSSWVPPGARRPLCAGEGGGIATAQAFFVWPSSPPLVLPPHWLCRVCWQPVSAGHLPRLLPGLVWLQRAPSWPAYDVPWHGGRLPWRVSVCAWPRAIAGLPSSRLSQQQQGPIAPASRHSCDSACHFSCATHATRIPKGSSIANVPGKGPQGKGRTQIFRTRTGGSFL